jgi:RimJ/RimL family protein N-acetyltransferase
VPANTSSPGFDRLRFEPLKEENLPTVFAWLQHSHVREFYQFQTPVWEEIRTQHMRSFAPDSPTRKFLISAEQPIGYIQVWRVADSPEYTVSWNVSGGISLDLFIGDPESVGQGWGRLILAKFLHEIAFPLFPDEKVCWIIHDVRNERAQRASVAAGFSYSHDVIVHDKAHTVLRLNAP